MKASVYDTAYNEFKRRYYRASGKAADNKAFCFDLYVCDVNDQQRRSARDRHCPVGKTAKNDLDQAVNYSSRCKYNKIFFEFIHNITYIMITSKAKKKHPIFRCFFPYARFLNELKFE